MRWAVVRGGLAAWAIVSVLGTTLPAVACNGPMMGYQNTTDAGAGTDATATVAGLPATDPVLAQTAAGQTAPAPLMETTRAVPQGWFLRWLAGAEDGLGTLTRWLHTFEGTHPSLRL